MTFSDRFYHTVLGKYDEKSVSIAQQAFPVIKDVYETRGSQIVNIVIPFYRWSEDYSNSFKFRECIPKSRKINH